MTVQDENGNYRSLARERRNQRRKQLGVGVAGLAVFAGAGSFVVQSQLIDLSRHTGAREPLALAPLPTSPSPSRSPSGRVSKPPVAAAGPGRVTRDAARQRRSPTPPPPPSPTPTSSPTPSPSVAAAAELNRHDVTTESGTIRVTSAPFDLTGKPELAIVGGPGWVVGAARCTKSVRSATGERVRVMPSMLVCWRTSPRRSVVTVAVADEGRPSSGESIAVIDREWARLR